MPAQTQIVTLVLLQNTELKVEIAVLAILIIMMTQMKLAGLAIFPVILVLELPVIIAQIVEQIQQHIGS